MDNKAKQNIKVEHISSDLQSRTERSILYYEILSVLHDSFGESEEQIEATIEVCAGFNETYETFAKAYMDTLQIEPEPDNSDVKTTIITKISELLKDAGYEILNSENQQGD
jgi:hypothetical protein